VENLESVGGPVVDRREKSVWKLARVIAWLGHPPVRTRPA
jgi:hypothetical protein